MINKYAGRCATCHAPVEAGAGRRASANGVWNTYHDGCVPARVAPPVGPHSGWHDLPVVGFDLEGTLPDPTQTRIVSAALVHSDGTTQEWLVDPGVPIPADATARHRITDEKVRADGRPAREALAELGTAVAKLIADATPLVAFCAPYDVTALHTELARHGLPAIDWDRAVVIDPSVLHQQVEPRWYGRRQLGDLCRYYEVTLDNAHDAASDARAAADLARSIAARHEPIARMRPDALHRAQVGWHAEQARGLQLSFDRRGIDRTVSTEWPLETAPRG
ncbi:exonuclease domain-containing protein [Micromonospora carbonacea]|uniref:DNA polymerase III subunit epsilon n=1 Tax=Micromonospora carbonacea TaxID=47853 RepID=A0A1C4Y6X1_9ACTN|nr:exonuclease domain-containing protein [Micromonospora carbonacea]MBB5825200.1 DNA polymerase-3 subunit epsilon [Micromonospora carbonacea]QLD26711.1 DNA polymerase III subunit epsilon [Micromonospora carbonacea]SCF16469.1 DNA polymerase-3 subunit epsilon [Micromonospora carbonacea]